MHGLGALATVLLWLGPVNLFLGRFNLVPGFPLDGGRVLRALLWGASGDLTRATRWASWSGQGVAWVLMGVGVMNALGGALISGLWLMLIGWFLNNAARSSYQQLLMRQALEDVPVTRLMRTQLDRVDPELSVDALVREHVMVSDQHAFPVESRGVLQGLVSFEDLRKVPQADWVRTPVGAVMTPLDELAALSPDADAEQALEQLAQRDVEQLPVVDEAAHLLGLVRRQNLVRWLALQGKPGDGRAHDDKEDDMATRAQNFRAEQQRQGPKKAPKARPPRRDRFVDTAQPGVSETDRKGALPRRPSKAADKNATYVLEDSAGKPSRKSTRKSSNRQETDLQYRLKSRAAELKPRTP